MKNLIFAAVAALALGSFADESQVYWYVGDNSASHHILNDRRCIFEEDGGATTNLFPDNCTIAFANPQESCWPTALVGKWNPDHVGQVAIYDGETLKAYGIIHNTAREIYGNGGLELGAGGYVQQFAWSVCKLSLKAGIKLTASQTWELYGNVWIESDSAVSCDSGTEWTIQTRDNSVESSSCLSIYSSSTLGAATVKVAKNAKLAFCAADASLGVDKLVLDGDRARLMTGGGDFPKELGPAIAKEVVLRNGACPTLGYYLSTSSNPGCVVVEPTMTYDLDKITVESGRSTLGALIANGVQWGFNSYSIKDGGTLDIEVKSGATLCLATYPTAGQIRVSGAGDVQYLSSDVKNVVYAENFTGSVVEPKKYWLVGDGSLNLVGGNAYIWESDEGATKHPWVDGNYLYIRYDGDNYWPTVLQGKHSGCISSANVNKNMFVYGINFISGQRNLSSTGHLDIGPGGYSNADSPGSWDYHQMNVWGGVGLCDSQTWTMKAGVDFVATCKLTAHDDITWTLTSLGGSYHTPSSASSRGIGVYIRAAYDLSNADIVMNQYSRILFVNAASSLKARSLTIDGTHALLAQAPGDTGALNQIGRLYSPKLILKNGASPALFRTTLSSKTLTAVDNLVYDLDQLTIESGTSLLGKAYFGTTDCGAYAYSIKEGATLNVEIKEGATLKIYSYPTSGRLCVSGAGTIVDMNGSMPDVDYNNFTGTITLSGAVKTIESMATFAGSASINCVDSYLNVKSVAGYTGQITLSGKSRMALPRTADWPSTLTVTTADTATLYLPNGEEVDTTKILGTANYSANAIGQTELTGPFTINHGDYYAVCGDGLGENATIAFNGGRLDVPVPSKVAANVTLTTSANKHPSLCVLGSIDCEFSGSWSLQGQLFISNTLYSASLSQQRGLAIFTGPGSVTGTSYMNIRSCVEFRGSAAKWSFSGSSRISIQNDVNNQGQHPLTIDVTEGASLDFADSTGQSTAFQLSASGYNTPCFKVSTNSTVRVGNYRLFILGDSSYGHVSELWVCGGKISFEGKYGGIYDTGVHTTIIGTTADRCPTVTYRVTDGGILETDRPISIGPVAQGVKATEGLYVTLDGGTYKLGENFGYDPDISYPKKGCNHLIGGTVGRNDDLTADLDYEPEVLFTIGPNGGTFDLSDADPRNNSFTNAPVGKYVPCATAAQQEKWGTDPGHLPTKGPRWNMQGELKVKGNGNQEFVINGLDAAVLTNLTADGVAVKVISDSAAENFDTLSLGAHGGSLEIVGENPEINVNLNVLENGVLDASLFDDETVTFKNATFASNSALWVRKIGDKVSCASFYGSETISLPAKMYYHGDSGIAYGTTVASSDGGFDTAGTEWSRIDTDSKRYGVEVNNTTIKFVAPPPLPLMLLVK